MKPYYEDGSVTIYHGDCREILPALERGLVVADPPYGINRRTDKPHWAKTDAYTKLASRVYPPVYGDDEPYDPTPMLVYPRVILFGANHYADRLPASPSWIVWDKLDRLTSKRKVGFNGQGDAELAWSNLGGPVRLIPHRWMGLIRDTEKEARVHPTQKPVSLMGSLIYSFALPDELIIEPYMGSGPVIRAAKALGHRAIGIEIEEKYCEIAANRASQEVLGLPA